MIAGQALYDMRQRPAAQLHSNIGIAFEFQRPGSRRFDRPSDPVGTVAKFREDVETEPIVEQHAKSGFVFRDPVERIQCQSLELTHSGIGTAGFPDPIIKLAAMVDRKDVQLAIIAPARRGPMQVIEFAVLPQPERKIGSGEEAFQFHFRRHGRRASMT